MTEPFHKDIAASLECDERLLPYLPQLLIDLWALGSSPELIVGLLKPLGLLARKTSVLDLGCGKGAVSILLARELGLHVVGIDSFEAFLKEAEEKAREYSVSHLCQFRLGDMREAVEVERDFDAIIYASVGGILGSYNECVGKLRECVRIGGYMVVDDGFLKKGARLSRKGYEHYVPYVETLEQLNAHGDAILKEVSTEAETVSMNAQYLRLITKRARELLDCYPEAQDLLEKYVENQKVECEILDEYVSGAIWLLQKR